MMRSLSEWGATVCLLTEESVSAIAREGLTLGWCGTYSDLSPAKSGETLTGMKERFRRYWGSEPEHAIQIGRLVEEQRIDAVVVAIAGGLPLLCNASSAVRVWYAADDQMLHSWSLLNWRDTKTWRRFREGITHGVYERVFRDQVDRVWLVSKRDALFSKWGMGARACDVIPNGVDSEYFVPMTKEKRSKSCVFWGRLDFAPNLDAIRWFGRNVWLPLRVIHPDAHWSVYGFSAGKEVLALKEEFGFELKCDLPDLRSEVSSHQVVVLPFVSGAGVKNKLLEAAALGMPIIGSRMALNGLEGETIPLRVASTPRHWKTGLQELWDNPEERASLGIQTRDWVVRHHSWSRSAKLAMDGIQESLAKRPRHRTVAAVRPGHE
jgi:glycosyltransferase involved in cell wall biosynthesis